MTAVEWLIEQLEWDDSKIARVIGLKKYNQVVSQAKEMEKQQQGYSEEDMVESFMACWKANVPEGFECKLSFKEWFNEFKKI